MFTEIEVHKAIDAACDVLRGGWCQHVPARDINNRDVHPKSFEAVSWCAWGALYKVGGEAIAFEVDKRLVQKTSWYGLGSMNDSAKNVSDVMLFLQSLKKDLPKT